MQIPQTSSISNNNLLFQSGGGWKLISVGSSKPTEKRTDQPLQVSPQQQASPATPPHAPASPPLAEITRGNVCLLCKRQFNSLQTLEKHVQLSDLHKV